MAPAKKKKTQTAEQKKKVETYKSKQKAMDKNRTMKRGDSVKSRLGLNAKTTRNFVTEFKDKDERLNDYTLKTGGRSAAKQEKAAIARNEAKRKPIMMTAKSYRKTLPKKGK
jgi:uncharacterized protein (DUF1330 family)